MTNCLIATFFGFLLSLFRKKKNNFKNIFFYYLTDKYKNKLQSLDWILTANNIIYFV